MRRQQYSAPGGGPVATIDRRRQVPQHVAARAKANRTRLARAELRHAVASGALEVVDVLADVPWEAQTMAIGELLACQRGWGPDRVRSTMAALEIRENKPLGALTPRQLKVIAVWLWAGR